MERLYFDAYHALDERIPRIRQLPDSQLVHASSLFTEEEMKTSLVYNEALPLAHTRDSLSVRLDGPDGSRIVWVIADPIDARGWSSARVQTIERLLLHLRQYVRVRQALVDARALGASLTALLENTRCGVIQLDRRGGILATNDRARDLLGKGDGLFDEDGLLHAASPGDDDALQKRLARALPPFGGQGAGGSLTVGRVLVSPRLVLHVSPVIPARGDGFGSRLGALVLVVDPASRAVVAPEVLAEVLGLTPAESHIALWLAEGKTVRNIALAAHSSDSDHRFRCDADHRFHAFRSPVGAKRRGCPIMG